MKHPIAKLSFFQKYAIALFGFVFIYLVLRAYFNEPLHDEVATFFNYIETGRIFGEGVIQVAQNHLLNTYASRWMYLMFGDDFFFLRIPRDSENHWIRCWEIVY